MPDGTPSGIEQLASLLRVYNSVMGGGLGFALEVNEPSQIRRAIDAMRYFGMTAPAAALEDVLGRSVNEEPPDSRLSDDDFYNLLDEENALVARTFRAKAADLPADFGLE